MATHADETQPTRRDFLTIVTVAAGAVGVAGVAWPFIHQLNPDASTLALATIDVDISPIAEGQAITVMWRGKPVFIRHRTAEEIAAAKDVSLDDLKDPIARNDNLPDGATAEDANRTTEGHEAFLVMVGICTHLGCVPLGQQGDYNGWFCPCHGSQYDTAGRIRSGPAPTNMLVPAYSYINDTTIRIG